MRITEKVTEQVVYDKYLHTQCDVCGKNSESYDKFIGILCRDVANGRLETKDVCSFDCFEKILDSLSCRWLIIEKIDNADTLRRTHEIEK